MEITPMQWRYCRSIDCPQLDGRECKVETCGQTDKGKALRERRGALKEVKDKAVKHG